MATTEAAAAAARSSGPKVDVDGAWHPQHHLSASMFNSVADLLSSVDAVLPAVAHPDILDEWTTVAEDALEETVKEVGDLSSQDVRSLDVAKEVGLEAFKTFLDRASGAGWSARPVELRRQHVRTLLSLPQVPQRTAAWYVQGKQVLTASEFGVLFKTPRAVSQMVLSKVVPEQPIDAVAATNRLACMTCEMGPFDWGVRFEPVVKQVLAERWGAVVVDSGRLLHPRDPLLAASPDGILLEAADPKRVGRLLEIKCPITRAVGGDAVPFDYWCQMQIQMEVTDIDECEYVEVKVESLRGQETELKSGSAPEGFVWLFQDSAAINRGCPMSYVYTEADAEEATARGLDLVEKIPWRVEKFHNVLVARDRAWFEGTAERRAKFWTDVAAARAGTYTPIESSRPPKKAQVNTKPQVIVQKEGATPPDCMFIDEPAITQVDSDRTE